MICGSEVACLVMRLGELPEIETILYPAICTGRKGAIRAAPSSVGSYFAMCVFGTFLNRKSLCQLLVADLFG